MPAANTPRSDQSKRLRMSSTLETTRTRTPGGASTGSGGGSPATRVTSPIGRPQSSRAWSVKAASSGWPVPPNAISKRPGRAAQTRAGAASNCLRRMIEPPPAWETDGSIAMSGRGIARHAPRRRSWPGSPAGPAPADRGHPTSRGRGRPGSTSPEPRAGSSGTPPGQERRPGSPGAGPAACRARPGEPGPHATPALHLRRVRPEVMPPADGTAAVSGQHNRGFSCGGHWRGRSRDVRPGTRRSGRG